MAKSRKSKKRGNASVVGKRNAGPRQLLPVEGLRLLTAILAELKGLREDVRRCGKEKESEEVVGEIMPAVADAIPEGDAAALQASTPKLDDLQEKEELDSYVEGSVPLNDVAPEKESQPQDRPIDQVGIVHQEVVSAGEGKRRHKPIDLLVKIYKVFHKDGNRITVTGEQQFLFQRGDVQESTTENNYVTRNLRHLVNKRCIEPAVIASQLSKRMQNLGHKEPAVREWRLLPFGIQIAERELLRQERLAGEEEHIQEME